ncbi:MAG: DUF6755 family protein, partial [Blastocatellia bacterium]
GMETAAQGATLFTAICVLIGTILVIQLWLVAAALDALLSNETSVLLPAAIASLVLCGINAGLLLYIIRFDKRIRRLG